MNQIQLQYAFPAPFFLCLELLFLILFKLHPGLVRLSCGISEAVLSLLKHASWDRCISTTDQLSLIVLSYELSANSPACTQNACRSNQWSLTGVHLVLIHDRVKGSKRNADGCLLSEIRDAFCKKVDQITNRQELEEAFLSWSSTNKFCEDSVSLLGWKSCFQWGCSCIVTDFRAMSAP